MIADIVDNKIIQDKREPVVSRQDNESPLHGVVASIDRTYGIAFVKADDQRVFGLSDGLITPVVWNRLKKGMEVSFSVNGFNSIASIIPTRKLTPAYPYRSNRD